MVAGGWGECESVVGGHEGEHRECGLTDGQKWHGYGRCNRATRGQHFTNIQNIRPHLFKHLQVFAPDFPQPPFYSQGGAGASALSIRAQLGHASQPMSTICQLEPTVSQIGFVPAPHPAPATDGLLPSAPSALSMRSRCRSSALSSASLRLCGESQSPARLKVIHAPGGKA